MATVGTLAAVVLILVIALFHGYFDPGRFEIKDAQWSSSKQIAVVAERSDDQAMSSYSYFVLIGDHVFRPTELRHAYHSSARVFAADRSCLALHWKSPRSLRVTCADGSINPGDIDVQKRWVGDVEIVYKGIPVLSSEKGDLPK
jgi:hypothetical protein